jgi:hypothetical protein
MDDLGAPSSYHNLAPGQPVLSSDGVEIGRVEHVLADPEVDVFDGVVIGVGGGHRFVDASAIDEVYERGTVLNIDAAAAKRLPEPSANPAAIEVDPAEPVETDMHRKLKRAWDLISGNY